MFLSGDTVIINEFSKCSKIYCRWFLFGCVEKIYFKVENCSKFKVHCRKVSMENLKLIVVARLDKKKN